MRVWEFVLAAMVANAAGLSAKADDWGIEVVNNSLDVKASRHEDKEYQSLKVWTKDLFAPEIRFSCSDEYGLMATITFMPAAELSTKKLGNAKIDARAVSMWIGQNGEVVKDQAPWTIVRKMRRIQTRSGATAAKIYNAVVMGERITFEEPFKGRITLTPPPFDDNFLYFSRNCHVIGGR